MRNSILHRLRRAVFATGIAGACIAPAEASADTCSSPATPIEHAICADEHLATLDREMNTYYGIILDNASAHDRGVIIRQQRAWLVRRDASCAAHPGPACLVPIYDARLGQLSKLGDAALADADRRRRVRDPVAHGTYVAQPLQLNARERALPEAEIVRQLNRRNLPAPGQSMAFHRDEGCLEGECLDLTWERMTIGQLDDRAPIQRQLGLAADQAVLVGRWPDMHQAPLLLMPTSAGDLSAIVELVLPDATQSWFHLQSWRRVDRTSPGK